ncbi:MAG: BMP family ABC transporter substrate-binding protein, partial [Angelakisella sp.]
AETAKNNPDQKFLYYDGECTAPNIASITYKQNDLGYLVGTAAALMTTSNIERMNPEKIIGFVGGEDGPVINDFLVGYIQGAQAVDKDIKVDTQYVGNFFDTGKGKELANVMFKNKCDVVWGVAGGAGNGAAESAKDNKGWFIGVDSDQEATFAVSQPEMAAVTAFSGLKNIGDSMVLAINQMKDGKLEFGKTTSLGLGEGGVGLTTTGNYTKLPEDIRKALDGLTPKVASGEIKVSTAFDPAIDVKAIREAARP